VTFPFITAGFTPYRAFHWTLPDGVVVTMLGANGAGKTSTLRTILGLVHPKEGTIKFNGTSLLGKRPYQIVKMGVAMAPEGRRIFPDLSVWENLLMGAYSRTDAEGIKKDLEWVLGLFPDSLNERAKLEELYLAASNRCLQWRGLSWPTPNFSSWMSPL